MQVVTMFRIPTSILRSADRAAADFKKVSPILRKRAGAFALAALVLAPIPGLAGDGAANPAQASDRSLRSRSIVDGMRLQPRPGDLERANRIDVGPAEAREVDELYRRLMDPHHFRSLPAIGQGATRRIDQGATGSC